MATIGVDLGGTKILVAAVHHGKAHHTTKVATPTTGHDAIVTAIVDAVSDLHDEHDVTIDAVGIGAPGPVDPVNGVVRDAPNLAGFEDAVPLASLVTARLVERGYSQVEVRVDNDVNVATRGEWRHGAGAGHDDLLAVWWGTGIGGGLVLDGAVRSGPSGAAAEIGHTNFVPEGLVCGCGRQGHVEAYAGRAALEAEARRRHAAGTPNKLVELAGDDRMKSKIFAEALEADDPTAHELLDRAVEALGVGIASAATLLDVDRVIIGGGLGSRLGTPWADRIQHVVRRRVYSHPAIEVVASALGDDAGVIGAAALFSRAA
jgi:glucokinase